jgi:hypothetical protein
VLAEILFVGATSSADIAKPQAIGMSAMLVSEFETIIASSPSD